MNLILVAKNTFRESVRDRVLYNLIVFALLMIASSLFIGELAIRGEEKIIVDLGLSAMRFVGMLIAIFIGIQLVYKEIERRTIYSLLSKPLHRRTLILGKFGGLGMTLAVNSLVMLAGIVVALIYLEAGYSELIVPLLPAAYLILLELLVTTSIALMFSTVSSPVISAILTFLLYVAGNFSYNFQSMAETTEMFGLKVLLLFLYYLLPNLTNFNLIDAAAYGVLPPVSHIVMTTVYAIVYCGLMLSVAVLVFERRDFK